ncbi:hypothetical protein DL771_007308 [Monosporascus sp. 5C6A]|nr:hypothetical protein DL771_007308 [Monosporascus sp. 5C6A]
MINGLPGFAGVDFEDSDSGNALDILTLDCGDLLFGTNILDPFGDITSVAAATINPTAADNDSITNHTTTTNNNNIHSHLSGNIQPTSSTSNLHLSPHPPSLDPFSALFPFPFPIHIHIQNSKSFICHPGRRTSLQTGGFLPLARSPHNNNNTTTTTITTTNNSSLNINIENNLVQGPRRHSLLLTSNSREPADQGIDDPYVAALATGDFSSPSLPPLSSSPLPPPSRHRSSLLPKPLEIGETMPPALRRSSRGSRGGGGVVDLTKEEPDFDNINSGVDPTTPMAPRTRKRHAAIRVISDGAKRRRTSQSSSRPAKARKNTLPQYDASSPFEEDFDSPQKTDHEDPDSIDLSNVDEVPTELMAPKADNRIKLGKFQCVICMDDVTALTVTHCGEAPGESTLRT